MTHSNHEPADTLSEIPETDRPGFLTILILLFLILTLLTSLVWPLLRRSTTHRGWPPTATPSVIQQI